MTSARSLCTLATAFPVKRGTRSQFAGASLTEPEGPQGRRQTLPLPLGCRSNRLAGAGDPLCGQLGFGRASLGVKLLGESPDAPAAG